MAVLNEETKAQLHDALNASPHFRNLPWEAILHVFASVERVLGGSEEPTEPEAPAADASA